MKSWKKTYQNIQSEFNYNLQIFFTYWTDEAYFPELDFGGSAFQFRGTPTEHQTELLVLERGGVVVACIGGSGGCYPFQLQVQGRVYVPCTQRNLFLNLIEMYKIWIGITVF